MRSRIDTGHSQNSWFSDLIPFIYRFLMIMNYKLFHPFYFSYNTLCPVETNFNSHVQYFIIDCDGTFSIVISNFLGNRYNKLLLFFLLCRDIWSHSGCRVHYCTCTFWREKTLDRCRSFSSFSSFWCSDRLWSTILLDHHVYRVIHRIFRRDCPYCCYENQLQGDACQWYDALPIHKWFQQRRYSTVNNFFYSLRSLCLERWCSVLILAVKY